MVDRAQDSAPYARRASRLTLVNTTGWVEDEAAVALKIAKIDLVQPDFLLAFPRGYTLWPILEPYRRTERPEIHLCETPAAVQARTQRQREALRRRNWSYYLRRARDIDLGWDEVGISGLPRAILDGDDAVGRVVGLYTRAGECGAVGPIVAINRAERRIRVQAPMPPEVPVARIHIGSYVLAE